MMTLDILVNIKNIALSILRKHSRWGTKNIDAAKTKNNSAGISRIFTAIRNLLHYTVNITLGNFHFKCKTDLLTFFQFSS